MHQKISQEEYEEEIKNFIGLSIDEVSVFLEPRLLTSGFSFIHIVDDEKKLGKVLGIYGKVIL